MFKKLFLKERNSMEWYEIISWIVTAIFPLAFLPQAITAFKNKNTNGVSKISYLIVFGGTVLLMLWGAMGGTKTRAILFSNAIMVVIELVVMFYMFRKTIAVFISAVTIFILSFILGAYGNFMYPIEWLDSVHKLAFMVIGGGMIGFAFAPQTISSLKTREIEHVSLLTASDIALNNVLLAVMYFGLYNSFSGADNLVGIIISIIGVCWQVPFIILKINTYLSKKKKLNDGSKEEEKAKKNIG